MNTPPIQNAPKKSTPWALIILGTVGVLCCCPVGGFMMLGLGAKQSVDSMNKAVETRSTPSAKKAPYKVDDLKGSNDYITGTLTNQSGEKKGYVQVEINLLDKSGAVVGSALANVNNLEAGQKWKFKAVVFGVKYDSFEVKNVSGF